MKKEDIRLEDLHRILFGESPPAYLLEVVVRVALVYILILLAMRVLGKRLVAKVGRADLVARVSLGAAVGLPIQRPNRGLLVAAVIVGVIVWVGRWLAAFAFRNKQFEKAFQGVHATLVKDGVLDTARMNNTRITRERLFAELRSHDVRHLGQVRRLYMEANGDFSLVSQEDPAPGLSVIPEWDQDLRERQVRSDKEVCKKCGASWERARAACENCGGRQEEQAILLPS